MSRLQSLRDLSRKFTRREIAIANATSRSGGTVGPNAIVPKVVRRLANRRQRLLDFGAGKQAAHAEQLERSGYDVTAYDYGANCVDGVHDPNALSRTYDVVYASNVLNVQATAEALETTLGQIAKATKPGGYAIANYPNSPRKAGLSAEEVAAIARRKFSRMDLVEGSKSTPVWRLWA